MSNVVPSNTSKVNITFADGPSGNYGRIIGENSVKYNTVRSNKIAEEVKFEDLSGETISQEKLIQEYKKVLEEYGFVSSDIDRVLNGEISIENLLIEIQNDTDSTRRQRIIESSYLSACGLEFSSMEEFSSEIENIANELERLISERDYIISDDSKVILDIIEKLKSGENLEDILRTKIWQCTDENGNVSYTYYNPYIGNNVSDQLMSLTSYVLVDLETAYSGNELLEELKLILSKSSESSFFGGNKVVSTWTGNDEQNEFYNNVLDEYNDNLNKRTTQLETLNNSINELQSKLSSYQNTYDYINGSVSHYMNNVDKYISSDDYYSNNEFNSSCLDTVNNLQEQYNGLISYDENGNKPVMYLNNEETVDIISCIINDKLPPANYLVIGNVTAELKSDNNMIEHYAKWAEFITEDEKDIFNYIYNTQGYEEAYKYLEDISNELDTRWLANKTTEDEEFASEHSVLSSLASIFVTPIEGMSAICYSLNSLITENEIKRTDVYSAGNVWRGQVSKDIANNYGDGWAFVYNTGMSMADSVSLIGMNALTGGSASVVLSASIMGSRAYVSTLNEALERGLSDGSAVALAFSSAVVESAMENYSLGHLANLESTLSEGTIKLANKIAGNIPNETVANLATKSFYIAASALSQGICEGEEEFATEILNYVTDIFIAKDLSNYSKSIENYLQQGYSENEALLATMKDFGSQAIQAFVGGFASGICFGSFSGVSSTINTSYGISEDMYSDLKGSTDAQRFAEALAINQQQLENISKAYEALKNGENLTEEQISILNTGTIESQAGTVLKAGIKQKLSDVIVQDNSSVIDKVSGVTKESEINIDENLRSFGEYYDNHIEFVKEITGKTDEKLQYLFDFRNKVLSFNSVENLLGNLNSFTEWEMKQLLNNENPFISLLINNQLIQDYILQIYTNKEILDKYIEIDSGNQLVRNAFLSLSETEIESVYDFEVFKWLQKFSIDDQEKFIDSHLNFFKDNINNMFYRSLNKNTFILIFEKVGSFDLLKNKISSINNLDFEIQKYFYDKYKNDIYNGVPKDFMYFAKYIKDPEYQNDFIRNSPFYSEIVNSSYFDELFVGLKSKDLVLEFLSNSDAENKIISSSSAFKHLIQLLEREEQLQYIEKAKQEILKINNSSDRMLKIFGGSHIIDYISGFDIEQQQLLLKDADIINSMSTDVMIKINNYFDGVYNEILKSMISGNFNSDTAKLLFEPSIYELMDQETINRAALALSPADYDKLIKLGNYEAMDIVVDKMIASNFSEVKGYPYDFIHLFNASSENAKTKISENITNSFLIDVVGSYGGEQFVDILVERLSSNSIELKVGDLRKISKYKTETYQMIYPYLNDKERLLSFNYDTVTKLGLNDEYIELFRTYPNFINYMKYDNEPLKFYSLLTAPEDINTYYNNIKIGTLFDISSDKNFSSFDLNKIKNILEDGLSNYTFYYFSEFRGLANILTYFNLDEQVEILNSMNTGDKYFLLLNGCVKDPNTKFELLKMMIEDSQFRTSIDSGNLDSFKYFFDNLELEYVNYILENADNNFLGFMLTIAKRNDLNAKFSEMIKSNNLILNNFGYGDAELIYANLSQENKILLETSINNIILSINNQKVNNLLEGATIAQKSTFIGAYYEELITDDKLDFLTNLMSKNAFVLSTFNYQLFDDTIYQLDKNLLTKLSKYYDVVDQIVTLKESPEKFNLFTQLIVNDKTSSVVLADQKMAMLLNYLIDNEVDTVLLSATTDEELEIARSILLKEIDQFTILDGNMNEVERERSLIRPDNCTLSNYYEKLGEKCDTLLQSATTVEEVQNLIFNKYFSMSIEDASEIFRIYGTRFGEIVDLDTDGVSTTFLEKIINIFNTTTMDEAIDIYNSFGSNSRYDMNEILFIINDIKQIYTKSIKSVLFNPTEITGYVDYDGKKIPVYEPNDDFHMLIQSTYTNYGGMPIINNNYFDSWNLSSRTMNHGICCSLISNNNMGMAAVIGHGIVIGFNSFSDEQINMMAPYDIYTRNDGYVIKCQRPFLYLPGQDVMNETRHTHNEFNLERTNLTGIGNLPNIQPDYVVVFEEMSQEQKNNAYKASIEFNVPLVYINKTTLAAKESTKIDALISEYKATGKVELLKDILVQHENNRSGYRNPSDSSLVTKYFPTDRIINILNEAISNITSEEELLYIKNFLEDEVRKFDATYEATHRTNEIDIDINAFIAKINNRIKILKDIESTKNMNFKLTRDNLDDTLKAISINSLMEVINNDEVFNKFQNYDEYATYFRFTRYEYLEAFMQLYNTIKKNNYNLGFTTEQEIRLENLYNEALEKLDISKIQYTSILPDDIKLKMMFTNMKIYSHSDLEIIYDYYNENFSLNMLEKEPSLIFTPEYEFYSSLINESLDNYELSDEDVDFWNNFITMHQKVINKILTQNIVLSEQNFKKLLTELGFNINSSNAIKYINDYLTYHPEIDISEYLENLSYNENLPDNIKIKKIFSNKKINSYNDLIILYDYYNKHFSLNMLEKKPTLIFTPEYEFYSSLINESLDSYELSDEDVDFWNNFITMHQKVINKILTQNIDLSEQNFKKLLTELGFNINSSNAIKYINDYLTYHPEIDISEYLENLSYNENLPDNIKQQVYYKINSNYDDYFFSHSSNSYGADQNATAKHIYIEINNLDWLTDKNDFISFLENRYAYKTKDANNLVNDIISLYKVNKFYGKVGNIITEYIYEKCARENRFDVIDIINNSLTFEPNNYGKYLFDKLVYLGMTEEEAIRTMCAIDSTGCCSYAAVINGIFFAYKDKPQTFMDDFGYPMFIYENGIEVFNSSELMLDMYIYINSNKFSGTLFEYDLSGRLHIKDLTTSKQKYLSYTNGYQSTDAINSFLKSKNIKLEYKIYETINYNDYNIATTDKIKNLKEIIVNSLKFNDNDSIELEIQRVENKNVRFLKSLNDVKITTENWHEGDGHSVALTGIFNDYFIVSSWGERYLIPISDFVENSFSVIFREVIGINE